MVRDPQGRPVAGAELLLFREGSAGPLARAVAERGSFAFPSATSGAFLLEVSAEGFRRVSRPVTAGESAEITLELAGVDQRVLVTAEASAQTVDQVSKAASIIGADEIAERNEYSLAETLRDTPGLLIRNLGGPGQATSVRIRGLRADATAVLIDGMRFRDVATIQGDASGFLSTFNVISFDRVEVLRGSGSSLYGSHAVGGAINVVTDPGGGPLHGGVLMEGGSLGLLRGRATVSGGTRNDRLTYSAGLVHLNVLSGVDGNDRARSTGVQSFVRYALAPSTSISARLFGSDDFVQSNVSPSVSGIPAANIPSTGIIEAIAPSVEQVKASAAGLAFPPGNATYIPARDDPDSRRASRFWTGAFRLRQQIAPALDAQVGYQRVHTTRDFQNGPAGTGFQPLVSNKSSFQGDIDTADARINWRARPWFSVAAGYEFEREGYLNSDDNRMPGPSRLAVRTEAGQHSHAAYFANQIALADRRLQISLSGRAQGFGIDRPRFVYSGTAAAYDNAAVITPPRALTGDAAVSYFLARSGTKLRAHGGNSYRAPGLYERFGSGFYYDSISNAVIFSPYGDPRLAPDRYNSIDAGIDQYLFRDRLRLSATWFYTRIVQITQFDSSASAVVFATDPFHRFSGYYNGAGGTSRGLETTAELRPDRSTLLRASYAYVNADTDQDAAVRGFFGALSVPAHSFTAFAHRQLGRKASLTVDLYRSSSYYNALFAGVRSRAYHFGGVTKIDAVAARTLRSGEKYSLEWYAKVENLLNQRFFENGFQGPRATALTGLRVAFR